MGINRPAASGNAAAPGAAGVSALNPQAAQMPVSESQGLGEVGSEKGLIQPSEPPSAPAAADPAALAPTVEQGAAEPAQSLLSQGAQVASRAQASQNPASPEEHAFPGRDSNGLTDFLQRVFDGNEERPELREEKASPVGQGDHGYPRKAPIILFSRVLFPNNHVVWRVPPDSAETIGNVASQPGGYFVVATPGRKPGFYPIASLAKLVQIHDQGPGLLIEFDIVSEVKITGQEKNEAGAITAVELEYPKTPGRDSVQEKRLMEAAKLGLVQLMQLSGQTEREPVQIALAQTDPKIAANKIANIMGSLGFQQKLLGTLSVSKKLRRLIKHIQAQKMEVELNAQVQAEIEAANQEGILQAKKRAIQKKLGEDKKSDLGKLKAKIEASGMNDEAKALALEELDQLRGMSRGTSEGAWWLRQHIDWLLKMPWNARTEDRVDIKEARRILDRSHARLDTLKERVFEELAGYKRTGRLKGKILCFVGPPGVGKTTIAKAMAEALGRKFKDVRLGGVSDASEIIGHYRHFANSIPGIIMMRLQQAGVRNPVMLLDEVDKLGKDSLKGDPASALLAVLDPDQNNVFRDHYLDVPFDLSEVFFIVTANDEDNIPAALRHRLEIIRFDSYTPDEKLDIARGHLQPKAREDTKLSARQANLSKGAIERIIHEYTREGGVRELDRMIQTVMRKVVARMAKGRPAPGRIVEKDVERYLGAPRFVSHQTDNGVGVATGLAVNGLGGDVLNIEILTMPGKGRLSLRKQMGDMSDDSAKNAVAYVRKFADKFGLAPDFFENVDIDILFTPAEKIDGPSAGAALATALVSDLTQRAVRKGVAMTGELKPRTGRISAIGGLKEKVLAAHRAGYDTVLYPAENRKDLEKIPKEVRGEIKLIAVSSMDEVLSRALEPKIQAPAPKAKASVRRKRNPKRS